MILGLITPGYDQFRDTISILAVMKYGWMQQINFLQLGVGLVIAGFLVCRQFTKEYSKTVWKRTVLFCTTFIFVEIIFPTDLISSTPITQTHLSLMGAVHLSALAVFFLLAPVGIYLMRKAVMNEPRFKHLTNFTATAGYTSSFLCYLWTYWFIKGDFYPYLGIMQKIIGLITFLWLIALIYAAKPDALAEG